MGPFDRSIKSIQAVWPLILHSLFLELHISVCNASSFPSLPFPWQLLYSLRLHTHPQIESLIKSFQRLASCCFMDTRPWIGFSGTFRFFLWPSSLRSSIFLTSAYRLSISLLYVFSFFTISTFFIQINIGDARLKRVVIDPGSALNIMPLTMCWALGASSLSPTNLVVYWGWTQSEEKPIRSLSFDLTLSPKTVCSLVVVLDQELEYNLLRGSITVPPQ